MQIEVFHNKQGEFKYNKDLNILYATFYGIINLELASELIKSAADFALSNKVYGVVADVTKLRGSYLKLFDLLIDDIYPPLIDKGMKVHATVISDDVIVEHVTSKLEKRRLQMGIESKTFTKIELADTWVKEILGHN